jgi:hypothetical protein
MATTTINLGLSLAGLNDVFIHKETTPSAPVTGTLTETQVYALTIPANSFSAGDKFVLDNLIVQKNAGSIAATVLIKLSTSSTMPTGGTDRLANPNIAAPVTFVGFNRFFNLSGGNLRGMSNAVGLNSSYATDTAPFQTKAFDPTVTNYLYISVVLGDVADSVTVHGYTLKNF